EDVNLLDHEALQQGLTEEQLAEYHRLQYVMDSALPRWDPAVHGAWDAPFNHYTSGMDFDPPLDGDGDSDDHFNAIHMGLIPKGFHQGRVIAWDAQFAATAPGIGDYWSQRWTILDVTQPLASRFLNNTLKLPHDDGDLFCVGQTCTAEGNFFLSGGTLEYTSEDGIWKGGVLSLLFVPPVTRDLSNAWQTLPDLVQGRWYPTVTLWGRDQILVAGGFEDSVDGATDLALNSYELYEIARGGLDASYIGKFPGPPVDDTDDINDLRKRLGLYPRLTVMADGRIFRSGYSKTSALLSPDLPGSQNPFWTYTNSDNDRRRVGGASVLLPNLPGFGGREVIMAVGGRDVTEGGDGGNNFVSETAPYSFAGLGSSEWSINLAPMHHKRWRGNAVILPDATIFLVGGDRHAYQLEHVDEDPITTAELFTIDSVDPNETVDAIEGHWQALPGPVGARTYHSTALLLPSGKILLGGGDTRDWDYQIYNPPYLLDGTERPVISASPTIM
ncbi:MAG: hypothetical protein VCB43_06175, partial [Myxococcota bacterium]